MDTNYMDRRSRSSYHFIALSDTPAMMLHLAAALSLVGLVFGRSPYRDAIPNGYAVPNPCGTSAVWDPSGHYNPFHHTHLKNPFGNDFRNNGHIWTAALCKMDSDRDGKTNGEELGDPNCVWTRGGTPSGSPIGHPGICEPVGSAACSYQNFGCDCLEHCKGLYGYP